MKQKGPQIFTHVMVPVPSNYHIYISCEYGVPQFSKSLHDVYSLFQINETYTHK